MNYGVHRLRDRLPSYHRGYITKLDAQYCARVRAKLNKLKPGWSCCFDLNKIDARQRHNGNTARARIYTAARRIFGRGNYTSNTYPRNVVWIRRLV